MRLFAARFLHTWCRDGFISLRLFPLNPNGKIDRKALTRMLDEDLV